MRRKKIKTERLHQSVARRLGTAILAGDYAPGDALGGEIEQSAALGVSRTAYREAMRILHAKGLLESRPKAGTHVTPMSRWSLLDPEVLEWMFTDEPNLEFVDDIFELRSIVEPNAAALAASRRSPRQLESMAQALDNMRKFGLASEDGREADRRFHNLLLEATCNTALVSLAGSVGTAVQLTTRFKLRVASSPRDPYPEHLAVFEAIEAGRPDDARREMQTLLNMALDDMHKASGRGKPTPGDDAIS